MSEIRVEPVAYDIDGQPYEGQLVYDASHAGPRPGLLMAPNWMGAVSYTHLCDRLLGKPREAVA